MQTPDSRQLDAFFNEQLTTWKDAARRYEELETHVLRRPLDAESGLLAQCNPARIHSATARVANGSVEARPCFLCPENRPAEQTALPLPCELQLLVNPFPILPHHFTLIARQHRPQRFSLFAQCIVGLAAQWDDYVVFYNGPRCGASAPDHAHLQAGQAQYVPFVKHFQRFFAQAVRLTSKEGEEQGRGIYLLTRYCCPVFAAIGNTPEETSTMLRSMVAALPRPEGRTDDDEADFNVLCWKKQDASGASYVAALFPRRKHRPDCYFAADDSKMLISPGALDMAGLLVCARLEDYDHLTAECAASILREVAVTTTAAQLIARRITEGKDAAAPFSPTIKVGLMHAQALRFTLHGDAYALACGEQQVSAQGGEVVWNGAVYDKLLFAPQTPEATFTLQQVVIGKDFHWQRAEAQTFCGALLILPDKDGGLAAINLVSLETYLESVVSSEMSGTSSLALLQAHAVISRSWTLRKLTEPSPQHHASCQQMELTADNSFRSITRWYGTDDHELYDVCADDHCQRYQGTTRITPAAREAVRTTRGQVLTYADALCDARFSKCCGGITERFSACWEDEDFDYLTPLTDDANATLVQRDMTEDEARRFILNPPAAYCHTQDAALLREMLNDYDLQTPDFYRWTERLTPDDAARLIKEKSGEDVGQVTDLQPLQRSASGRITRLRIVGTKRTIDVGKELEIRRLLSPSHLKSSAFIVEREAVNGTFVLHGAGWGHGVGLCQIGAAAMAAEGKTYEEILTHYYHHANIQKVY